MCGISGIFDLKRKKRVQGDVIKKMMNKLVHRGPDQDGHYSDGNISLGFTRLSIIDLEGGKQPLFNENGTVMLICNGEIFNYIELRQELIQRGHRFKTKTDIEVVLHLYEEAGMGFLNRLNGQFAFAIYDLKKQWLFCARDHFGIIPFYYTICNDFFIFGSEIKAVLAHADVPKEVDLVGLDQVFSFPGLICPRTMFKNIKSLENGHYLTVKGADTVTDNEYWDMIYPREGELEYKTDEGIYTEKLNEQLTRSVRLRLRADVPVGLYISGGLDSSLISVISAELRPEVRRFSFSIDFEEEDKSEAKYQKILARHINSNHIQKKFFHRDISERLKKVIYHSEYPLKETYNTASLALSESAREKNIKVVLSGEGADEWFAGYPGYKFDKFRQMQKKELTAGELEEKEMNKRMWGDQDLYFDINQHAFQKTKKELYSQSLNAVFDEFDSLRHKIVNKERLRNRHRLHQRSYLDFKLRLVSHLISDHGDRMTYANSVEGRYPFLDKELVEFAATVPPDLKLKEFEEKYILKKIAERRVPGQILKREKFAFHAPGSPYLLNKNIEYIDDLLSYELIKRQGYFNPGSIEKLKNQYGSEGFRLNIPYESDLLITAITFGIFLEEFNMPAFN